jgi:mannose-6-phosphate isomerase-like protein (cupin superfamily)
MIKKNNEYEVDCRQNMRGGDGEVKIEHLWDCEKELKANNRLFARMTFEPGSGIGFHKHDNEEEVFVIIKGQAEADDDGKKVILNPGDTILTADGAGHSIKSIGDEPLELLAVISCYNQ